MPIVVYTLDQIEQAVFAFYRNRFPGRDLGSESWLGKQARAISMALLQIQSQIQQADNDGAPSSKNSSTRLDTFAFIFGLPSNLGGYGRNGAIAASGGAGPVTGTNGTVYADGLLLTGPDGVTQFKLSGSVTIGGSPPGSGSFPGIFVALTTGTAGNLPINSELTWVSPPSGSDATVELTGSGLSGGLDIETDAALLARILTRLQSPPKGGAAVDYRTWALAGSTAITRAYVYPNRGGLGTVQVVLTQGGSGTARAPSTAVQTTDDAYVATVRPVTVQGYMSLLPAMPASNGLTIRARMKPSKSNAKLGVVGPGSGGKYDWDWDDTSSGPYTVDLYTVGPPDTLRLNTTAPPSLTAAVDAYNAGTQNAPHIFCEATGAPAIPVQAQVTSYVTSGGKTTLTLALPPSGWVVPSAGNAVHAGGPLMTPIATALNAYVDSLGPSRADGTADPNDQWEDTCAVARLTEIALDVTDTDGVTKLAINLAVSGGITINGGTTDKQGAQDIGGAPELLYCALIVVTQ